MQEWLVEEYVTGEGNAPFSDWLFSLKDKKGKDIILSRIKRLKLKNFGDCRFVGEKIFELRIDFGPGYRVYCAQVGENTLLLLRAGDKRSQSRDIDKARKCLLDYRSRTNEAE